MSTHIVRRTIDYYFWIEADSPIKACAVAEDLELDDAVNIHERDMPCHVREGPWDDYFWSLLLRRD